MEGDLRHTWGKIRIRDPAWLAEENSLYVFLSHPAVQQGK
jgi:hypothetical protein